MVRGGPVAVADQPGVDAGERRERRPRGRSGSAPAPRAWGRLGTDRGGVDQPQPLGLADAGVPAPGRRADADLAAPRGGRSPPRSRPARAGGRRGARAPGRATALRARTRRGACAARRSAAPRARAPPRRGRARRRRRTALRAKLVEAEARAAASTVRNSAAMRQAARHRRGGQHGRIRAGGRTTIPTEGIRIVLGCPNCGARGLVAAPEVARHFRRAASNSAARHSAFQSRVALAPDLLLDAALGAGRTPLRAGQAPLADHDGRRPVLVPHATNGYAWPAALGQAGALPGR